MLGPFLLIMVGVVLGLVVQRVWRYYRQCWMFIGINAALGKASFRVVLRKDSSRLESLKTKFPACLIVETTVGTKVVYGGWDDV